MIFIYIGLILCELIFSSAEEELDYLTVPQKKDLWYCRGRRTKKKSRRRFADYRKMSKAFGLICNPNKQ